MKAEMPGTPQHNQPRRFERWLFGAVLLVLLACAGFLICSNPGNSSFSADPRFVLTTKPSFGLPANATFGQRAFVWQMKLRQRFGRPHPMSYSFPATVTNRCSIQGLLNQCMEVTGIRYAIPIDVAAGTVEFGHTNTLNGVQWAKAFTDALQTSRPEWWDSKVRRFRKENLVLVTNESSTVLVLPKELVLEFQKRRTD